VLPQTDKAVADVIAVDLEKLTWWHVPIDVGVPRRASDMVVLGNRVLLFGGSGDFSPREHDPGLNTFSITECATESGKWRWAVREQAYPADIKRMGYGGRKVLLLEGRHFDKHVGGIPRAN
jgi:hypothetical protein